MRLRYCLDEQTGEPHIYKHNVEEHEVEEVLAACIEERPGRDDSRVAAGQTEAGRYLRVIYVPDAERDSAFVITAYDIGEGAESSETETWEEAMKKNKFPEGWDEGRVRRVLEHYATQSDEEAVAEDEAAYESTTHTMMEVPVELVPQVRELLAKHRNR